MTKSLEVINSNNERTLIKLGDASITGYAITNIDGLDAPVGTINLVERTMGDGSIYNGSRANARNVVIYITYDIGNVEHETIEDLRHKTYRIFPVGENVKFIFSSNKRKVKFNGYIESNEVNIFDEHEGSQISVLCEDAYFRAEHDTVENLNGVNPLFEFPFDNNSLTEKLIEFGEIFCYSDYTIFYDGEVQTGCNIHVEFSAEVNGFKIFNNQTGEILTVNHQFGANDVLDICTIQGKKSVTLNSTTNLLTDTSWNKRTWFIIRRGYNDIEIRDGSENEFDYKRMTITYPIVYMGA